MRLIPIRNGFILGIAIGLLSLWFPAISLLSLPGFIIGTLSFIVLMLPLLMFIDKEDCSVAGQCVAGGLDPLLTDNFQFFMIVIANGCFYALLFSMIYWIARTLRSSGTSSVRAAVR